MANVILKGRIETTPARAKEIRPRVERLVTIGRRGRVSDFRMLAARLPRMAAEKLFYEVAPRYRERRGGYLRIVRLAHTRRRDGASRAVIEFVQ